MASRRGFQPRSQIRQPRRINKWGFGPDSIGQTVTASGSVLWTNGVQLGVEAAVTDIRLRGFAELLLSAGTALDGFRGALGIGYVSEEAFAIGITAIPTPVTDSDWGGWIWHQFFELHNPTATAGVESQLRFNIDSKAMRKVTNNQLMVGVMEANETGVSSLTLHADTRVLSKLS